MVDGNSSEGIYRTVHRREGRQRSKAEGIAGAVRRLRSLAAHLVKRLDAARGTGILERAFERYTTVGSAIRSAQAGGGQPSRRSTEGCSGRRDSCGNKRNRPTG